MREILPKILEISSREDYFGKIQIINIAVALLSFAICIFTGIEYVIFGHTFMLMWISSTACQLFSLHRRKKAGFVWVIGALSKNQITITLLIASILQNILFIPLLTLQLLVFLDAAPAVAISTAVVHFFFAISIGAFLSTIFRYKYAGLGLIMFLYLFFSLSGAHWTGAELYRCLSPVVQIYNMYITDTTNLLGLAMFILLACTSVFIAIPLSPRRIGPVRIAALICSLLLFLSVGGYEQYHNQITFSNGYNTFSENGVLISYRGIDRVYARQYAKMIAGIDERLYEKGVTSGKLSGFLIQKYYAPIYSIKARRIPFIIEGDTMFVNVFSNAMLNTKDAGLMYDILYRITSNIVTSRKGQSNSNRNTDEVIYRTINEAVHKDSSYSDDLKNYSERMCELVTDNQYNK